MKAWKKTLSGVLALVMVLCLLPAMAYAEEDEANVVECSSIDAVVTAINNAGTAPTIIKLITTEQSIVDTSRPSSITIGEDQNITIDLNGCIWRALMPSASPYILNEGNLTIQSSDANGVIQGQSFSNLVVIQNTGTLHVSAGISCIANASPTDIVSSGALTISEGASLGGNVNTCPLNITSGSANITGGKVNGALQVTGGDVTITGGTFSSDVSEYVVDGYEFNPNGSGGGSVAPSAVPVESVTISGETSVTVGETITLTATVTPENATDSAVTWRSGDESVATVDAGGVVSGVAAGTVTITAAAGDKEASCTITVSAARPSLPGFLPGFVFAGAGSQMQRFADVTSMDYYFDAVNWAAERGITGGTGKVTFSPDAPCTRAQAVTFLWRAMGSPRAEKAASFTDVKTDAYYADAVAWAVVNGITNGTSATTFSPDAPCTRAQIVTLLYRAIGVESTVDAGFVDVPANAYYKDAIDWATQYKITGGTGANRFSPDATCTRAQIVTFLYRAK